MFCIKAGRYNSEERGPISERYVGGDRLIKRGKQESQGLVVAGVDQPQTWPEFDIFKNRLTADWFPVD